MFRYLLATVTLGRSSFPYSTSSASMISSSTVAYLTNSCGLTPEKATSLSKLIEVRGAENAGSMFELLRSYGFTHNQLGELVSRYPCYLLADAETNLKPKMQYMVSMGISRDDLPQVLSNKWILSRNLKKHIVPTFEFLKENIPSYGDLVVAIRRSAQLLRSKAREYMMLNMATLRAHGVPEKMIVKLMTKWSTSLMLKRDTFEEEVKRLLEYGFQPTSLNFVLGLSALATQSKMNWKKKRELFRLFGWSDEEFVSAFKVQPMMMVTSEAKLRQMMEFFVGRLGLEPSQVAKCPNLFLVSLKKRVIPRCSVLQVLLSNGLIRRSDVRIITALNSNSAHFTVKYLAPFQGVVPDLLEAYKGNVEFKGFSDELLEPWNNHR
ncbi:hypothetical protein SAY87_022538 [Trapa incisa]|uniref:Uncharacterized protein n=1 Tax=Trapa incisa TaxID=236973 RepID=A0AAN7Q4I1_9MYRT|nr:hypothetical protein SAY87_022538 [Trapa incisa]